MFKRWMSLWMAFLFFFGGFALPITAFAMGERPNASPVESSVSLPMDGTYDIQVDGLACPLCAYTLQKKLSEKLGEGSFEIRLEEGILRVREKKVKTPVVQIEKIIQGAGFTSRGVVRDVVD